MARAATYPAELDCRCHGSRHVVCRPLLPPFRPAPISDPPARPRVWHCGCEGRSHLVCDPAWRAWLDAGADVKPLRFASRRDAIRAGLIIRPHGAHVYTCPAECDRTDTHWHRCLCSEQERRHFEPNAEHRARVRVAPVEEAA